MDEKAERRQWATARVVELFDSARYVVERQCEAVARSLDDAIEEWLAWQPLGVQPDGSMNLRNPPTFSIRAVVVDDILTRDHELVQASAELELLAPEVAESLTEAFGPVASLSEALGVLQGEEIVEEVGNVRAALAEAHRRLNEVAPAKLRGWLGVA